MWCELSRPLVGQPRIVWLLFGSVTKIDPCHATRTPTFSVQLECNVLSSLRRRDRLAAPTRHGVPPETMRYVYGAALRNGRFPTLLLTIVTCMSRSNICHLFQSDFQLNRHQRSEIP